MGIVTSSAAAAIMRGNSTSFVMNIFETAYEIMIIVEGLRVGPDNLLKQVHLPLFYFNISKASIIDHIFKILKHQQNLFTTSYNSKPQNPHKIEMKAMFLSKSLLSLTTLSTLFLSPFVHAGCYSGGELWNDAYASKAISKACKHLAGRTYSGHTSKLVEVKVPHQCYKFILADIVDESRFIGQGECLDGMTSEWLNCHHGGSTEYTHWGYT
jgi:hypothetical protein